MQNSEYRICSRCVSILLGVMMILFYPIIELEISIIGGAINTLLMQVPMFLDGYTQLRKVRKSNNYLRTITGFISGCGISIGLYSVMILIFDIFFSL
ncbi:DUF2085 domain-containing protein [uncultured Clostridium sp.]|uniref:DUF2085 domain-containing protein n=1 Tax=uncultured Clostridium sp. TaxID=59620 RepID=UPI002623EBA5|nr:DUF2085 domain-containing protein [uncultured Clostridium sp.]